MKIHYTLTEVDNHNPYLFGADNYRAPERVWMLRFENADPIYYPTKKMALEHIERVTNISKSA
jgi:hypothetical protein